jgi:hypothetical protein
MVYHAFLQHSTMRICVENLGDILVGGGEDIVQSGVTDFEAEEEEVEEVDRVREHNGGVEKL